MMNTKDSFIGPVNLGNPNEISINKLALEIKSLTKSNSKIIYNKFPDDDPKRRRPDISLAIEKLEWNPLYELETGLEITIEYFKNLIKTTK